VKVNCWEDLGGQPTKTKNKVKEQTINYNQHRNIQLLANNHSPKKIKQQYLAYYNNIKIKHTIKINAYLGCRLK
jgi:hypothetical protein